MVDSLREDLEATVNELEKPEETGGPPEDAPESVRDPAPEGTAPAPDDAPQPEELGQDAVGDSRPRGPDGKFLPKDPVKGTIGDPNKGKPPAPSLTPSQPNTQIQQPQTLNPPLAWKQEAKAEWAKLPPQVQQEIVRREQETARVLSQTAHSRRFVEDFTRVVSPYANLIRSQNSTPLQAVDNLMKTAAGLSLGTPQQKAEIIRDIIRNYAVDIQTLDAVLSNSQVPTQAQAPNVQAEIQKALAPVMQFMGTVEQARAQRQQQMQAEADAETEKFAATHEFFDQVRDEMADLMEVAASRGRAMTMEQAYKLAISNNEELSAAVQQREAAKRAAASTSNLQRSRTAAKTIAGAPRAPAGGPSNKDGSLRGDLLDAIEQAQGR